MSKARVSYVLNETPASSAKQNQQITDYIVPGHLIFHVNGSSVAETIVYLGWYLYNPAKSVYNRIRLVGTFIVLGNPDRSFDGGATWVSLGAGSTTGIPATMLVTLGDHAAQNNNQANLWDIDISGVASTQWIGFRLAAGAPGVDGQYNMLGFLYNATDTPF